MRLAILLLSVKCACAQSVTFDAASVKPSAAIQPGPGMAARVMNTGGPGTDDPGRIHYPYATIKSLVMKAYDVADYQVYGPASIESDHYEINAAIPRGATMDQFRMMLQNLLEERVKLKFHREQRDLTTYTLVVAKGGPKMKESEAEPGGKLAWRTNIVDGHYKQTATLMGTSDLAMRLGAMLNRQVTDDTGLTGKYDFILEFGPDGLGPGWSRVPGRAATDPYPPVFAAMPTQIGLRLEPKKSPVDAIVVDRVEKPAE
jgi:uncharacterized protein (TIGR03435 family)